MTGTACLVASTHVCDRTTSSQLKEKEQRGMPVTSEHLLVLGIRSKIPAVYGKYSCRLCYSHGVLNNIHT